MTIKDLQFINDLIKRGFNVEDGKMQRYCGSISRYNKCEIFVLSPMYNEYSDKSFYLVSYESFSECGEISDHHIIEKRYIHESELTEYLQKKGYQTDEEIKKEIEERRNRLAEERRARRERRG